MHWQKFVPTTLMIGIILISHHKKQVMSLVEYSQLLVVFLIQPYRTLFDWKGNSDDDDDADKIFLWGHESSTKRCCTRSLALFCPPYHQILMELWSLTCFKLCMHLFFPFVSCECVLNLRTRCVQQNILINISSEFSIIRSILYMHVWCVFCHGYILCMCIWYTYFSSHSGATMDLYLRSWQRIYWWKQANTSFIGGLSQC